jgi:outer membrane receptor protein involved in Fe transport
MSGAAIALFAAPGSQALAQAGSGEDVVVTGTRIVRNGYSAPTPVTVVATEDLAKVAPNSIAEGLNQLPQFNGSNGNSATRDTGTATKPGVGNYLSLRNLGAIRTLVLLDGQRLPPTTFDGTTDANIIPSALVQRVDVVTGGASAAYGSDAVSGVINFVLDTKFNGIKGEVQGGISRYDDGKSFKISLAGGRDIADGRGHLLFAYDRYRIEGVASPLDRPGGSDYWVRVGATPLSTSAAGTAANPFVQMKQGRFNNATGGTLFQGFPTTVLLGQSANAGNPYRGYTFLPGGVIKKFDPGQPTGTQNISIGGDGTITVGRTLTGTQDTNNYFGRFDFDVAENVQAFAQLSYADNFNSFVSIGSGTQQGDFKIAAENAFLPSQVSADLIACGAPCAFTQAGRVELDQPYKKALFDNYALAFTSGLKGTIGAYDWRLGYTRGDTLLKTQHYGNFDNQHWFYALDAVRDTAAYRTSLGAALAPGLAPAQGNIVCRATLTNPTQAAGCVPINIFGTGSPSQAAWDYVSKISTWQVSQQMDIFNGSISGDLFALPAGPISFAVGGEYRKQKLIQTSNNDPTFNVVDPTFSPGLRTNVNTFALQYNSTNVGKAHGEQDIKEAFTELAVPILKDSPIGDFDLNAAGRYTDYETSGIARTWKLGLSYSPLDQLRFRATKSKDIRAPNLYELFAGRSASRGNVTDPHITGGLTQNAITYSQGNSELQPEEGDTKTIGVVWRPDFIPGLSMSVDYYNIDIAQAIGTASAANILTDCENSGGTGIACTFIQRPLPFADRTAANFVLSVASVPFNQAAQKLEGFDYEVNYRVPFVDKGMLGPATLDLHLIGSFLGNYQVQARPGDRIVQSNNTVGNGGILFGGVNSQNNIQNRINLQANYTDGPVSLNVQARYLGAAKYTQDATVFYVDNTVPAMAYFDATISYEKEVGGKTLEAFLTVNNIFEPSAPVFGVGQPGQGAPTNANIYDVMGRYYTTGLRFKF